MTKAELEKKKKLARTLYMAGKDQNEIADQIDISRQTLSKWANQEGWKEQRAATSVTRPELVNKLLHSIDTLITDVNASGDAAKIAGLGDKLAKMSAVIEKLDKKANVVDAIEVFMAFSKWMQFRAQNDPISHRNSSRHLIITRISSSPTRCRTVFPAIFNTYT